MKMTERTAGMVADYLNGMSRKAVADKYGVKQNTVNKLFRDHKVRLDPDEVKRREQHGGMANAGSVARPIPDDLAIVGPTMTRDELAAHYSVGKTLLKEWLRCKGVQSKKVTFQRPVPDDFAANVRVMHASALARHYSTGFDVIARWCGELGVQPQPAPKSTYARPTLARMGKVHPAIGRTVHTPYDDAAYVLRKFFAVNRCNDRGGYDPKGKFWRVGVNICTPDELLSRAERYRERAA